MTKNRARIRAAKSLAASSDIRHPDASYLADHRKLRLPDGTIHDFAQGPLRLSGNDAGTARSQAGLIRGRAEEKKWFIAQISADNPTLLDLIPERPCLAFILGAGTPANTQAAELAADTHPDLNIVIVEEAPAPVFLGKVSNVETAVAQPLRITGQPGIYRTARGWAQIEAADAALDALGVPQAAQKFATHTSGLFLVTGRTGAGKTMTGAALLRRAYYDKGHAAAAIMHPFERGLVSDFDVTAFSVEHAEVAAPAIREAVSAGARIILVEDLREPSAIEAALDAALGGALVIATMHSQASEAAQRLLDAFPNSGNVKIRAKVQLALRGVLEQVLVRKAGDQTGRVLASEVWVEKGVGTDAVLSPVITLEESLQSLVEQGAVDPQAVAKAILHRY